MKLCISILGISLCPISDRDLYINHCQSIDYIFRHEAHYSRPPVNLFQDKTSAFCLRPAFGAQLIQGGMGIILLEWSNFILICRDAFPVSDCFFIFVRNSRRLFGS